MPVPERRAENPRRLLKVINARGNNLKNVTAEIPLGLFTCVTGVSGGGKSTLLVDTLYKAIARKLNGASEAPAPHDRIEGIEHLDKVIDIDQSPIGRTPRSNPATYTGAFTPIREWFAGLPESKARGYEPGRFSFNVKGGRCEACQGDGVIKIEMHFLPDVYVTCDVCKGKRYNRETLEVLFKGKSIADVLDMTVEEALDFFKAVPRVRNVLELLHRVGLDYIHVGQQATTLSGGEAQRVKLAKELSKRATGRTLYILDEPTTGLHFHDVAKLLEVLHELVEQRQHRGGDRAQSGSDQDRRLDHRSRPRRRRRRRRDRGRRHARGHRQGQAQLYRAVPGAGAGAAGGEAQGTDRGGGVRRKNRSDGMDDTLARIQALVERGAVRISDHGYEELAADDIYASDVLTGVISAVLIAGYPRFAKGPTVLVFQKDSAGRPIHVVWGIPKGHAEPAVVVTAYRPDPAQWTSDFMHRRTP